jgi:hypothetical protein
MLYDSGMTYLIESGGGLMVVYEEWVMAVAYVAALVFFGLAALSMNHPKKMWGHVLTAAVFTGAGYYFMTYHISLTNDGGKVYAFLWHDQQIAWKDVAGAQYVEQAALSRSGARLMIADRSGARFELPLKGIYGVERQKVLRYLQSRLPVRIVTGQ